MPTTIAKPSTPRGRRSRRNATSVQVRRLGEERAEPRPEDAGPLVAGEREAPRHRGVQQRPGESAFERGERPRDQERRNQDRDAEERDEQTEAEREPGDHQHEIEDAQREPEDQVQQDAVGPPLPVRGEEPPHGCSLPAPGSLRASRSIMISSGARITNAYTACAARKIPQPNSGKMNHGNSGVQYPDDEQEQLVVTKPRRGARTTDAARCFATRSRAASSPNSSIVRSFLERPFDLVACSREDRLDQSRCSVRRAVGVARNPPRIGRAASRSRRVRHPAPRVLSARPTGGRSSEGIGCL